MASAFKNPQTYFASGVGIISVAGLFWLNNKITDNKNEMAKILNQFAAFAAQNGNKRNEQVFRQIAQVIKETQTDTKSNSQDIKALKRGQKKIFEALSEILPALVETRTKAALQDNQKLDEDYDLDFDNYAARKSKHSKKKRKNQKQKRKPRYSDSESSDDTENSSDESESDEEESTRRPKRKNKRKSSKSSSSKQSKRVKRSSKSSKKKKRKRKQASESESEGEDADLADMFDQMDT